MKNLKKVMSVLLAGAMASSLMGAAFAADVDFGDADKINNTEAVEVMTALGVIQGDENGDFNPQGNLTRETAAKIIAYMLLGEDGAEALNVTKAPFSDVAATRWSAPYVAYCAEKGIIAGNGSGKFNPTDELTSTQFAKMCLVALGYRADQEGMTGDAWAINTSSLAVSTKLNKNIKSLTNSAPMTREDAAQMAYNMLTTTLVEYTGGMDVSAGDVDVTVNATRSYVVAANGEEFDAANVTVHNGDNLLQFCEKYFEDLKTASGAGDSFGRPSDHAWELDGEQVYDAVAEATVVYSGNMNSTSGKKQIASDLKGYVFTDGTNEAEIKNVNSTNASGSNITVDSVTVNSGANIVDGLASYANANGEVVEIFTNSDKEITNIVKLTYIVEKVNAISTNRDGDVTYTLSVSSSKVDYADDDANSDTIKLHGDVAKGDYVTTYTDSNSVVHVYPTTKITGQQTATNGTTLTISGKKYDLGLGVETDGSNTKLVATGFVNSSKDANYYIDQFGYVVACTDVAVDTAYAVVNKIAAKDVSTGLNTGKSVEAELVLADGTKKTVNVAEINGEDVASSAKFSVSDTSPAITWTANAVTSIVVSETNSKNSAYINQVVTYSVNSDGEYELTFIKTPTTLTTSSGSYATNKGVPAFGDQTKSGNTSTVYVIATTKGTKTVFTSYTGFTNVPTIKANGSSLTVTYMADANGKVEFVYIDATSNADVGDSTVNNIFFTRDNTVTTVASGDDKYYTIDGILDGVATTVKTKTADFKLVSSNAPNNDTFYELTIDEDGYTTACTAYSFTKLGTTTGETVTTAIIDGLDDGVVNGLLYNDDTVVYVIDKSGDVTEGTVGSMAVGDKLYGLCNTTGTAAEQNTLTTLYIVVA